MKKVLIMTLMVMITLNVNSECLANTSPIAVDSNAVDTKKKNEDIRINLLGKNIVFSDEYGKAFKNYNNVIMVPIEKVFKELNMKDMQIHDQRVMGYYNGEMVELYRNGNFIIGGNKVATIKEITSLNGNIYAPLDKIMNYLYYKVVPSSPGYFKIEKMGVSDMSYIDLQPLTDRKLSKEEKEQEMLLVSKVIDGEEYSKLNKEQLEQMKNLNIDEVKEKISTIYDFITFLNVKGFSMDSGNLGEQQIKDRKNNHTYYYNFEAEDVYNNNVGNCGGIANLAKYILEDDYEELGYIHTARADNSGHVINYFLKDGFYYLVDFTDFPIESGEGIFRGRFLTMEEALDKYGVNDVLVYYYSDYEYQIPSTAGKNMKVRYIPKECSDIVILKEEGISIDFITTFPKEIIPNKIVKTDKQRAVSQRKEDNK